MASERLTARGFEVPTSLLRSEWPPNDGLRPGDERFDVILASIREEGIREPLTIKRDWTIIDGAHRFFAALLLGLPTVPVIVWTGSEMVFAARAQAAEAGELDVALLWEVLEGFGVIANGTWVSFQREDAEAIAHEYALRRYARLAAASAEPPEEGA